jgi:gas vesicle protein
MYLVYSKFVFMNNTAKILIALAAGVAAGAVVGILFAPSKGEETRDNIMKKGKAFADDIAKKFKDMKEGCKEKEEALN